MQLAVVTVVVVVVAVSLVRLKGGWQGLLSGFVYCAEVVCRQEAEARLA